MPQSDETAENNRRTEGDKRPNLSRWFWGTIGLLIVITVSLELLATWQAGRHGVENSRGRSVDQTGTNATQVERWFNTAGEEAEKVREQIRGRLDEAYAPVYAGIPKYMDFHYSLTGEWLELGSAAMGNLGGGLEKHLFDGFDARLSVVSEHLALEFDQRFWRALDEAMAAEAGGAEAFGPVVTRALRDSQNRMKKTAGTVGVALVGGHFEGIHYGFREEACYKARSKGRNQDRNEVGRRWHWCCGFCWCLFMGRAWSCGLCRGRSYYSLGCHGRGDDKAG